MMGERDAFFLLLALHNHTHMHEVHLSQQPERAEKERSNSVVLSITHFTKSRVLPHASLSLSLSFSFCCVGLLLHASNECRVRFLVYFLLPASLSLSHHAFESLIHLIPAHPVHNLRFFYRT